MMKIAQCFQPVSALAFAPHEPVPGGYFLSPKIGLPISQSLERWISSQIQAAYDGPADSRDHTSDYTAQQPAERFRDWVDETQGASQESQQAADLSIRARVTNDKEVLATRSDPARPNDEPVPGPSGLARTTQDRAIRNIIRNIGRGRSISYLAE